MTWTFFADVVSAGESGQTIDVTQVFQYFGDTTAGLKKGFILRFSCTVNLSGLVERNLLATNCAAALCVRSVQ